MMLDGAPGMAMLGCAALTPTYIVTSVAAVMWCSCLTTKEGCVRYRRARVAGGTFFFTVNLADRSRSLLTEHVAVLRDVVGVVKRRHPFCIVAWVVLPEHMHAVWAMPADNGDYSMRWMLIKQRFSKAIALREGVCASKRRNGERDIWQRRFWEHQIRNDVDLQRHVDYVHINPVKHGYVARASDWAYSSIHRYIRCGDMAVDWACVPDESVRHGE
jgi:putative transposase